MDPDALSILSKIPIYQEAQARREASRSAANNPTVQRVNQLNPSLRPNAPLQEQTRMPVPRHWTELQNLPVSAPPFQVGHLYFHVPPPIPRLSIPPGGPLLRSEPRLEQKIEESPNFHEYGFKNTFTGYRVSDLPFHGVGTFTDIKGTSYSGEWNNGFFEGKICFKGNAELADLGKLVYPNFKGRVTLSFPPGSKLEGQVQDGLFTGRGLLLYAGGHRYDGEFVENLFHGFGRFIDVDKVLTQGRWFKGKKEGEFEVFQPNGVSYRVLYENGITKRIVAMSQSISSDCPLN